MIAGIITSTILVGLTLLIHYEILRLASAMLPSLPIPVRMRVIFVVFAAFLAHTLEVWLYAFAFYVFIDVFHFGAFGGTMMGDWRDYVYFSAVTYTSLGLGDVFPLGGARLLTGVEALNGLVMIGWSASFTYLTMEKFWPLHTRRGK
ncbi:MAG TPA: ion channel [Alphaproteobacteria bacterium]|nr:ion channel [Alphaproteobacteria bacterium]